MPSYKSFSFVCVCVCVCACVHACAYLLACALMCLCVTSQCFTFDLGRVKRSITSDVHVVISFSLANYQGSVCVRACVCTCIWRAGGAVNGNEQALYPCPL